MSDAVKTFFAGALALDAWGWFDPSQPRFKCRVCGCDTEVAPDWPARAVCPEHCEDHQYQYDLGERQHSCVHCNAFPPDDWYDRD